MRLHRTKYANMSVNELLCFADRNSDSLTELGRELMYRLESLYLHPADEAPHACECDEA